MVRHLLQKSLSVRYPVGVKVEFSIRQGLIEVLARQQELLHPSAGMHQVSVGKPVRRIVSNDRVPATAAQHLQLHDEVDDLPLDTRVPVAESAVHVIQEQKGTLTHIRHIEKILYLRSSVNPFVREKGVMEFR